MNELLTPTMITKESLRVLTNNLTATLTIDRQYDDKFAVEGAKIGQSLNIRLPIRYIVSNGQALQLQDAREEYTTLTLTEQFHIGLSFSSVELALKIEEFSKRIIGPAVEALANEIDRYVLSFYDQFYQAVGTPGVIPNTALVYLQAGGKLNDAAVPRGMRSLILSSDQELTIVDALKTLFQNASKISEQYTSGQMLSQVFGWDWHMDQNVPVHTYGVYAGTPLVDTADQVGSAILTDGWSSGASTLNRGDILTFGGVFMVNPQSRRSIGKLQQFRVVNTVSDTAGAMTITIDPPIVIAGPKQNVTNAPANNAPITVAGATGATGPQGMGWHKQAMTLACADLPLPRGADMASRVVDKQLGISMRLWRQGDIWTDTFPTRLDILCGALPVRKEMGVRIQG